MNSPRPSLERFADAACTGLLVFISIYFLGHIIAALLRWSFEVSR